VKIKNINPGGAENRADYCRNLDTAGYKKQKQGWPCAILLSKLTTN